MIKLSVILLLFSVLLSSSGGEEAPLTQEILRKAELRTLRSVNGHSTPRHDIPHSFAAAGKLWHGV